MKVIYIAGKYRASTEWELEQNIRHAEAAAIRLWQEGYAVICPHMNSAHLGGTVPDQTFLDGDLEILRRCDAIYLLFGWENSVGARQELALAETLELGIFYETYTEVMSLNPSPALYVTKPAPSNAPAIETPQSGRNT